MATIDVEKILCRCGHTQDRHHDGVCWTALHPSPLSVGFRKPGEPVAQEATAKRCGCAGFVAPEPVG